METRGNLAIAAFEQTKALSVGATIIYLNDPSTQTKQSRIEPKLDKSHRSRYDGSGTSGLDCHDDDDPSETAPHQSARFLGGRLLYGKFLRRVCRLVPWALCISGRHSDYSIWRIGALRRLFLDQLSAFPSPSRKRCRRNDSRSPYEKKRSQRYCHASRLGSH